MIVTIDEAAEMLCPILSAGANQGERCHHRGCMAWREVGDGKGYCGVAGLPNAGAMFGSILELQKTAAESLDKPKIILHQFVEGEGSDGDPISGRKPS